MRQSATSAVFVFWTSGALITYAYVGYAIVLSVYRKYRYRAVTKGSLVPTVSIVMAVRDEEALLVRKLLNLAQLDYPQELIEIVVAVDGASEAIRAVLDSQTSRVKRVLLPLASGKANALNAAVREATGEILVFFDVRQIVDRSAVSELVSCFADPRIGAVSGELLLEGEDGKPAEDALGLYWRIEKKVRQLESATGSVVGVTGAIYAMRRESFVELPSGTILDDVLVPMNVARTGQRVVFHPGAIARDRIFNEPGKEFSRKVRTLTGNYQLLKLAPWLLSPSNPLLFRLISHKLLRLVVPALLILLFVSSFLAGTPFYRTLFALQLFLYALALLGAVAPSSRKWKPVSIAYTFAMLNVAAAMAFYEFISGRARWA